MNALDTYDDILLNKLEEAKALAAKAHDFLRETKERQRPFGLFQPKDNVIVIVRPSSENKVEAALGFPFPVARQILPVNSQEGEITVCFRSDELRRYQRSLIVKELGFDLIAIKRDEMINRLKTMQETRKRSFYINPYAFLGDSIIGLYFLERIKQFLNIQSHIILSPSAEHQSFLGDIYSSSEPTHWMQANDSDLVILPDLIDNHLPNTLLWIRHLLQSKAPALIIGRGLLIDYEHKIIYALNEDDPLLRNSNIQDYMDDCLEQFIGRNHDLPISTLPIKYPFQYSSETFINPFASLAIRDLSVEFIVTLVDGLIEYGVQKINISNGVKTSGKDKELIAALQHLLKDKPIKIEYHWFDNLSGIAALIKDRNINLLFSPDTSVPHMFNAMGQPVFTVYKTTFWDARSIQSMASDSPLGFCRYQPTQIPILAGPGSTTLDAGLWQEILKCFQKKIPASEALKWIKKIDALMDHPQQIGVSGLEVLAECAKAHGIAALIKAFDMNYFLGILNNFPQSTVNRLYKSLIQISPVYKWLKLQTC